MQLLNWFCFYCGVRTFSNSLEAVLSTVALCFWPLRSELSGGVCAGSHRPLALTLAALAVVVRPTAAVLWVVLGVHELHQCAHNPRELLQQVALVGCGAAGLSAVVDRIGYGTWTCSALNFLWFNAAQGLSRLYGVHPWHWYFTEGFTAMVGTMIPYVALGLAPCRSRLLALACLLVMLCYSSSPHKEFRFVLPCLPIAMVYAGHGARVAFASRAPSARLAGRPLLTLVVVSNLLVGYYMSRWHQSGPVALMEHLSAQAAASSATVVHLWMPCHATPLYSSMHHPIQMWFPDCSPVARLQKEGSESQQLEEHPAEFLSNLYAQQRLPTHVAMFENMEPDVRHFLRMNGYVEQARFFHQHFSGDRDDPSASNHILVFRAITHLGE
eukprot:TRINITY_DN5129_c0_g1_i3.p1 TRINITY_DN5129_c0_g1~~TRINITY_DN5129_c0_g1_i3.p1  ORF type:complete len:384 (-),score=49.06 TRINITY_DN5129_c0_g1_i3:66-1217(-)